VAWPEKGRAWCILLPLSSSDQIVSFIYFSRVFIQLYFFDRIFADSHNSLGQKTWRIIDVHVYSHLIVVFDWADSTGMLELL
jgi:hypothetical protein